MNQPLIRVVGIHIRGLGPIRSLDLPHDGLGWEGKFPDVLMVGGPNGSGKSTLLRVIVFAVQGSPPLNAEEARLDFEFATADKPALQCAILVGNPSYLSGNPAPNLIGVCKNPDGNKSAIGAGSPGFVPAPMILPPSWPRVVYFPSEDRTLVTIGTQDKRAGRLKELNDFVYEWRRPAQWEDSLEGLLYNARWEDLNAKEEGRFQDAVHFAAFANAFAGFFGPQKALRFHQAEPVIEILATGERHPISALSSGEKQVVVLAAELLRAWRPGSLILIDEPELHLHTTWQIKLWELLVRWQKERGGQVILATQSGDLFRVCEPGSAVLLGGEGF